MSIKITLELPSIDHAIATLAKLRGDTLPKVGAPVAASVTAPAPTSRPPRADKGKPRKAYKPRETGQQADSAVEAGTTLLVGSGAEQGAEGAVTESRDAGDPGVASSTVVSAAPAPVAPTSEEAQKLLETVYEKKGLSGVKELLVKYGVRRALDVPAEKRADFINDAKGML